MGVPECREIVLDHRVGDDVVVLRFQDHHVALERRGRSEGAVRVGADGAAAEGGKAVLLELLFRQTPVLIPVEGRDTQRQPPHGAQ